LDAQLAAGEEGESSHSSTLLFIKEEASPRWFNNQGKTDVVHINHAFCIL
jgi:hypothetical protein